MDERTALRILADTLSAAGDDAAVADGLVVTTDMLHETTDFPTGTTRYTAGWRSVGASLSDVAAMGVPASVAVAAYAAPSFEESELAAFVRGAQAVCERVDAAYVGGDLDHHEEFTVATTAIGRVGDTDPVLRSGASPGEAVCVTGAVGRSAAGLRAFEVGDADAGNELFRFTPRVFEGCELGEHATAMMDSSDGLARSLHQLSEASDCGFAIERDRVPVHDAVSSYAAPSETWELAAHFGEDFELVCTIPQERVTPARDALAALDTPLTVVGETVDAGVTVDGASLADKGYTHGQE